MGDPDRGVQVRNVPERVGWRLQPHEARPSRADGGTQRRKIGRVDELDVEAPRDAKVRQPLADAPVENPRHENVIAR